MGKRQGTHVNYVTPYGCIAPCTSVDTSAQVWHTFKLHAVIQSLTGLTSHLQQSMVPHSLCSPNDRHPVGSDTAPT